jgi:predicted RNase H-related nuclease YkuK (DUF458 family)
MGFVVGDGLLVLSRFTTQHTAEHARATFHLFATIHMNIAADIGDCESVSPTEVEGVIGWCDSAHACMHACDSVACHTHAVAHGHL